jgi:hypothetical protein
LILLVNILFVTEINSQYKLDWAQTYGGDARDEAFCIIENHNGDLILGGYTKKQEKHLWIISVNENGQAIWGKTFKARPISEARSIAITSDSNLVVAGYSVKEFLSEREMWILKISPEGKLIWDKSFGGVADECAYSIIETYDKGFAVAGFSSTNKDFQDDAWILKLDAEGNKIWSNSYGGSGKDYAYDIIQSSDKSLVFCGYQSKRSDAYMSFWVAKTDSAGNDLWDNTYHFNKWDVATTLVEGLDGYIYVAGYTRSTSVIDYDIVILKIDQEGNEIWKKTISWGRWDQATSITTTYDNGIVISGFTRSGKEMSSDFAVTKLDSAGNVLWENVFARKSLDYPNAIIETRDNGLAIAGTTYTQGRGWDFALLKFRNEDQPTISFSQDSIATSINQKYLIHSCIKTKSNLKNIQVFFNDTLYADQIKRTSTQLQAETDCNIPIPLELELKKGLNTIKVVITDYKNHQIINECKVYFIPPSEIVW